MDAEKPTRKPRGFKIALIVVAILFLLFACAVYFLPYLLPVDAIKSIANKQARDLAGLSVDFKHLSFGWNGDVVLENVVVSPATDEGAPKADPLVTVDSLRTNVAITPLLSGKAVVNSVVVDGFSVKVRREADGSLNLPDFSKLGAEQASRPAPRGTRIALAATAEATAAALPPIEVHHVALKNGILGFSDIPGNLAMDVGLEFMEIEGKTLDDPFVFSGRLLPYPGEANLGEISFSGQAAMLSGGQFNPNGEANLEIDANAVMLERMAEKFGLGDLLPSLQADGTVKAAFSKGLGYLNVPGVHFTRMRLGLGEGAQLEVPDSLATLEAVFNPDTGAVDLASLSLANEMAAVNARGGVEDAFALARGDIPAAALDFSGSADFAKLSAYVASQKLLEAPLPALAGKAGFTGKAALPAAAAGQPLRPSLAVELKEGDLEAADEAAGYSAGLSLGGIQAKADVVLDGGMRLASAVALPKVPAWVLVPQLGDVPVGAVLNGGAALELSPGARVAEIRLSDTTVRIPSTPWSNPAEVLNSETRLIADLAKDSIAVNAMKASIGSLRVSVDHGNLTGVLAGSPSGGLTASLDGALEEIKKLVEPAFPADLVPELSGALRATANVTLRDGVAEALVNSALENANTLLVPGPDVGTARVQSPKNTLAFRASVDLSRPDAITVHALEAAGEALGIAYADRSGTSAAGQTGAVAMKAAGAVDLAAMSLSLSSFTGGIGGLNVAFEKDGARVASLTSGAIETIAATPETILVAPLGDKGDFKVTSLDFSVENLAFSHRDEQSNLGNVRANIVADGYIGPDKRQLVNLRNASFAAAPAGARAAAQFDLGTGALAASYHAQLAPAGLSSLLQFIGMPPAILSQAEVAGELLYNGKTASSKGSAKGQLHTGAGDANPFEMAHDLSATWNPDDVTLQFDIRNLAGNVKTPSGEVVATLAAQPSKLVVGRTRADGFVDLRVSGSAGPTRALLAGLTGILPQLSGFSRLLHDARADGVYTGAVQVSDKDSAGLAVKMIGNWKGAALALAGTPYLAEAGTLMAGLEGEYAYRENRVTLSNLAVASESSGLQAQGQAVVVLTVDADNIPNGLSGAQSAFQFVVPDLAKTALVFPGVVPADLALAGGVSGQLKAGGDPDNLVVEQGVVQFRNFRAVPAPGMDLAIPAGAANFGASVSLAGGGDGTPWDAFKTVNVRNAAAALTGATLNGNAIDEMGAAFQLENGVLTLNSAKVSIGGGAGGSATATAMVDFNHPFPEAAARWSVVNLPVPIPGGAVETLSMNGDFSLQAGQANLPAFSIRTGSGLIQADGAGAAAFTMGPDNMPNGIANASLNMQFGVSDLARVAQLLSLADLGLSGSVNGGIQAGGEGQNIRISQGVVNFKDFRALPSPDLEVLIPSGAANFSAVVGAHFDRPATGSPYDILRMVDVREAQAALSALSVRNKPISGVNTAFQLENGILSVSSATLGFGQGNVVANAVVDFNSPAPAVRAQFAMRNFPLSEVNDEIKDFMTVQSGLLQIPAQGNATGVSFVGLSEDEILQTLRLENFNFATGPVVIHTGPALNEELDKARSIMRQQTVGGSGVREITFSGITGTALAAGDGYIVFPEDSPITLVGDNTADFQARGRVVADHTMDMKVMVAGKMENLIGFTIPNIIPNLGGADSNSLMERMNASAAKGRYGVHVKGSLSSPDISGIGALARQFLMDLLNPAQILGGVINLGKDTPGAILDLGGNVVEGLLNPADTVKNAPENVVKGLGQMFGVTRDRGETPGEQDEGQEQENEENQRRRPNIRLPFGIR